MSSHYQNSYKIGSHSHFTCSLYGKPLFQTFYSRLPSSHHLNLQSTNLLLQNNAIYIQKCLNPSKCLGSLLLLLNVFDELVIRNFVKFCKIDDDNFTPSNLNLSNCFNNCAYIWKAHCESFQPLFFLTFLGCWATTSICNLKKVL
jgi:hypothetical protein